MNNKITTTPQLLRNDDSYWYLDSLYLHDQAAFETLLGSLCLILNSTDLPEECNISTQGESEPVPQTHSTGYNFDDEDDVGEDTFYSKMGLNLGNQITLALLYSLIMGTALLGNGLVLMTVACKKSLWKPMYIFITSLAVSDVVLCLSCVPINIALIVTTEWTLGGVTCKSLPFFMNLGSNCSMLTLCCMAAERFVAIVHPLKFNAVHTLGKTAILLLAVWFVAVATASPFAMYYHPSEMCGRYFSSGECAKYHKVCLKNTYKYLGSDNIHWLSFMILFLLPAIVLLVAYSIIIYNLWMKRPSVTMLSISSQRTNLKKKAVKMLVLVVVLYLVSWSPLQVFTLVMRESNSIKASQVVGIKYYLECLAFSSTAYNPIVYAFLNQSFRNNFRNVLLRKWRRVAPFNIARDGLAPERVDAFKTASSNFDAGTGIPTGLKSENYQVSRRTNTTHV